MILFLSMNKDGVVSLWDDPERREIAAPSEIYIDLELTSAQKNQIGRAWVDAKSSVGHRPKSSSPAAPRPQVGPVNSILDE